jgi:ABC-2 type transport system permease protein
LNDLNIYLKLAVASIKSRMEYRGSFVVFIITVVLFYTAQIATVGIVLNRFKTIGGWKLGEIVFLYSLLILSQSVVTFVFSGILDFSTLVREGTYDRMLIRPLSTMGQVLMGAFEISGFANLIMGVVTFIIANSFVDISWTLSKVLILLSVIIGSAGILGGIRIIIAAVSFYAINNQSLVHLFVYSSREFLLYPLNIYNYGLRFLLTFIIPLGFVNYYPAHFFLDKTGFELFHPYIHYFTLPIGMVVATCSMIFWRFAQRRYESAGA